jgi:AcrR family transcriptional regulator
MSIKRNKTVTELFGLPDPPKTGRQRLVAVAIELFYTHGFQAVGIDRILAEAGVTKSTFYKHFESKDDLMADAIKTRDDWEMQAWTRALEVMAGDDPRQKLLAFFDVLDTWFNDEQFNGCAFINAAVEFPNPNDPIHQIAAEHKRKNRDYFRQLAVECNMGDPDGFADQYTVIVEGTLILRQVHGRDDAARLIRPAVEAMLEQFAPKA